MSNIKTGDIVEPTSPRLGLPRGSTWRVTARIGNDCELSPHNDCAASFRQRAYGRRFSVDYLETVGLFRMVVEKPRPISDFDSIFAEALRPCEPKPKQVIDPDMLVAQAAQALDNAKELQAKARRKAAEARKLAEKQAKEAAEREAEARRRVEVALRIDRDKALARATIDLLVEINNLNAGGPDRPANQAIAAHAAQLDPLARSYGYKVAKAGSIFVVTKA